MSTNAYSGWLRPIWAHHLRRQVWGQTTKLMEPGHPAKGADVATVGLKTELQAKLWSDQRLPGSSKESISANVAIEMKTGFREQCQLGRLPYFRREICFKIDTFHVVFDVMKGIFELLAGRRIPKDFVRKMPGDKVMLEKQAEHDRKVGVLLTCADAKVLVPL